MADADPDAIVRDLATRDLVVDIEPEWGTFVCFGCPDEHDETYNSRAEVVHAEDCVTQRARAWVAAHPLTGDGEWRDVTDLVAGPVTIERGRPGGHPVTETHRPAAVEDEDGWHYAGCSCGWSGDHLVDTTSKTDLTDGEALILLWVDSIGVTIHVDECDSLEAAAHRAQHVDNNTGETVAVEAIDAAGTSRLYSLDELRAAYPLPPRPRVAAHLEIDRPGDLPGDGGYDWDDEDPPWFGRYETVAEAEAAAERLRRWLGDRVTVHREPHADPAPDPKGTPDAND